MIVRKVLMAEREGFDCRHFLQVPAESTLLDNTLCLSGL